MQPSAVKRKMTIPDGIVIFLVEEGGFTFLRKSHAGCNVPPARCQEPAFEFTLK